MHDNTLQQDNKLEIKKYQIEKRDCMVVGFSTTCAISTYNH